MDLLFSAHSNRIIKQLMIVLTASCHESIIYGLDQSRRYREPVSVPPPSVFKWHPGKFCICLIASLSECWWCGDVVVMVWWWWCAVSPKLSACFQQTSSSRARPRWRGPSISPLINTKLPGRGPHHHHRAHTRTKKAAAAARHQTPRPRRARAAQCGQAAWAARPDTRGAGYWRGGGGQASIICTQSARSQPSHQLVTRPMPGRDTP